MQKRLVTIILMLSVVILAAYVLFLDPIIREKVGWHFNSWLIRARVWLNPPEDIAFSSNPVGTPDPDIIPTPNTDTVSTDEVIPLEPLGQTGTLSSIPAKFELERGEYFSQHNRWNYCGPANIAMLLSMWGWEGTPDDVARAIKPYKLDKNVMPYEMAEFADEQPGIGALVRVGGDLDTLKRLIATGFPVVVEKGPQFRDITYHITWMGHYQLLNGYDDDQEFFIAQDSYIQANYEQPYDTLIDEWRSFNYTYLVVYPDHMENDLLNLLGDDADINQNYTNALKKAQDEIYLLTDADRFFAYFNYGTNLVNLRDYQGAADAYDQAFALYDALEVDVSEIPYRILWYQTGPFYAYYYTGRYQDVIKLATEASIEMVRDDEPALEESYYWRGKSKIAVGDKEGGIEDFLTCLEYHPGFSPCIAELNIQGVSQ
jgi:hypothetical protein